MVLMRRINYVPGSVQKSIEQNVHLEKVLDAWEGEEKPRSLVVLNQIRSWNDT